MNAYVETNALYLRRGDSLDFVGTLISDLGVYLDLTAITIRCSVRRGTFSSALTIVKATQSGDTIGQFTASATYAQTAAWPAGILQCDVECTASGQRVHTDSFQAFVSGVATP